MTPNIPLRVAAALAILFGTASLTSADEAEPPAKLKTEKPVLQKPPAETNTQIDKIQMDQGVNWLGLTLVNPTAALMKQHGLPAHSPGPIMVEVHDRSFFPDGMAPTAGCAFWIVEHPAKGFFFNKEKSRSHYPKTLRELAEALLACTVTPEEYQKIFDQTSQAARERAERLKEQPAARERMLKVAESRVPKADVGKYICRVVYNYPGQTGTMTTYLRMTKADLDRLREFLKK